MADEFTKAALYGIKTFNKKAKEKIGMIKLIELLNECKPLNKGVHYEYNNGLFIMYDGSGREIGTSIEDEVLISKKYGFIKWLVENKKIDFSNIDFYFLQREQYTKIESLLMLLSISDTPIEDLISYLK